MPTKQAGLCFKRDRRLLASSGAPAKRPAPFIVHRVDVANGRYQIGYLLGRRTMLTPHTDVGFGRCLLAVLDFGDLGAVPTGQRGQLPAGQLSVSPKFAKPVPEDFAGLANRARQGIPRYIEAYSACGTASAHTCS